LIPNTSITEILKNQSDFATKETLLQQHGRTMGVRVGRSPVAHPEIAGEGVEYVWGAGKIYYRSRPLKEKRSLGGFMKLVKYLLSDAILSKDRVQSFARHARQYMLGYRAVASQFREDEERSSESGDDRPVDEVKMSHALMEKCVKLFKKKRTHCNAADFDSAFIRGVLKKMQKSTEFGNNL
jgi:hypothetical protein